MRPIGMVDTIRAIASTGCLSMAGVSVGRCDGVHAYAARPESSGPVPDQRLKCSFGRGVGENRRIFQTGLAHDRAGSERRDNNNARALTKDWRALLQRLLVMNIEAEKPRMAPSAIAVMVLSFFSGLCIERNFKSGKASSTRKIENFMTALRSL